jgi:hypothetical protein
MLADADPPESDAEIAINTLADRTLRRKPVGMGEESPLFRTLLLRRLAR